MQMQEFKYMVRAKGAEYYCKVSEVVSRNTVSYTFSFGGQKFFCFSAAMDASREYQPYISHIDYMEDCVKFCDLVSAALWTMMVLFDHIRQFTFIDDSYIHCEEKSKLYKLSLAYDYIFKRNQTWYENKFGATLPDPLFAIYKQSLEILDKPLVEFEHVVRIVEGIKKYKDVYVSASSPRDFISKLRVLYKDDFCMEVCKWFSKYCEYLGIRTFKESWYIDATTLKKSTGYELFISTVPMRGGRRKSRVYENDSGQLVGIWGTHT